MICNDKDPRVLKELVVRNCTNTVSAAYNYTDSIYIACMIVCSLWTLWQPVVVPIHATEMASINTSS